MTITLQGTPWCLDKVERASILQQRLLACIFIRPNGERNSGCGVGSSVAAVVPTFLSGLAKARAAWDGGTVRLALTNKPQRGGHVFFFFQLSLHFISLFLFPSVCIHCTHPQVAKDLNMYYSLFSNPSFVLIFKRSRVCMYVYSFNAWQ